MKISLDELRRLTRAALLKQGYDETECSQIMEVLLYAQMRGNNQGVVKLIGAGIPKSKDAGKVEITKETAVTAMIDAHHAHPMAVILQASEIAIKKARENGLAIVGINHINTSTGAIGYYAGKIAEAGLVGIVMGAGPETVAPSGSTEAVFGTNPLAIGVPNASNEPVVLDMTTAAMAFYGVVEANAAGRALPEGIAYDAEGNPSTDAAKVLDGALRPFDRGLRGSGLSMMIQLLAGPLVGAGSESMAGNWGHLIIAINPEAMSGTKYFLDGVSKIVDKVKGARKLQGVDEIMVPGERGRRITDKALSSGEIEIEDGLYAGLKKAAE